MNLRFAVLVALAPSPSGRGRGVRGFTAWHVLLIPLTLPLSQRERGKRACIKIISTRY